MESLLWIAVAAANPASQRFTSDGVGLAAVLGPLNSHFGAQNSLQGEQKHQKMEKHFPSIKFQEQFVVEKAKSPVVFAWMLAEMELCWF